MRRWGLAGVLGLACVGCVGEPIGRRGEPILHGVAEAGHPEVVIIVHDPPDSPAGLCTGTVIAPFVVLTAKHCAWVETSTGWRRGSPDDMVVAVGTDATDRATITAVSAVDRIVSTPGDDVDSDVENGDDIALLMLRSRLPGVTPRAYATSGPAVGTALTIVGYGEHDTNGTAGQKYRGVTRVSRLGTTLFETAEGAATCQGDSGGPAIDPAGAVAGITSFGFGGCGDSASYYTRVVAHRALIEEALGFEPTCTPEPERCDGRDNDCDEVLDEGCVELGERCASDVECAGGGRCASVGGRLVCTEECEPTDSLAGCPADFVCEPTACGAGLCVRDLGGALADGEECLDRAECAIGQCNEVGGALRCGRQCTDGGVPCPGGQVCQIDGAAACGACVPEALATGPRAFGGACDSDADCRSGRCADGGFCTGACGAHPDCPSGFHCRTGECARGELGGLGARCAHRDDCRASAPECVELGDERVCAVACPPAGCPTGFTCGSTSAGPRCVAEGLGLGEDCTANDQCRSRICAGTCTVLCDADPMSCPDGYECRLAGAHSGCFPVRGGGCAIEARPSRASPEAGALLLLAALAFVARRARR